VKTTQRISTRTDAAPQIMIAGRSFVAMSDPTAENDVFVRGIIENAGLGTLLKHKGEDASDFARRILGEFALKTDIFVLLGGVLLPAELVDATAWTPEIASETAAFLRKCRDQRDKKEIQSQLAAGIMSFVRAEHVLLRNSPKSSMGNPLQTAVSPEA